MRALIHLNRWGDRLAENLGPRLEVLAKGTGCPTPADHEGLLDGADMAGAPPCEFQRST